MLKIYQINGVVDQDMGPTVYLESLSEPEVTPDGLKIHLGALDGGSTITFLLDDLSCRG